MVLKTSPEVELMETKITPPRAVVTTRPQNFSGSWINGNDDLMHTGPGRFRAQNFSGSWINGNISAMMLWGHIGTLKTSPEVELMETSSLVRTVISTVALKTSPEVELMETFN